MGDFIFAMIKLLSLPAADAVNVVDYGLKKEIIKVAFYYVIQKKNNIDY